MIRACSNRYGKIIYELFDGYIHRSLYQPTKTHITCPLVPPKIVYDEPYCVPHTCMWNPFIISTPSYNGYNMENTCGIACDMQEPKKKSAMAIKYIHENHDFYYIIHLTLPTWILIMHNMVMNCRGKNYGVMMPSYVKWIDS